MNKKFWAKVLVLAMIMSVLPMAAMAAPEWTGSNGVYTAAAVDTASLSLTGDATYKVTGDVDSATVSLGQKTALVVNGALTADSVRVTMSKGSKLTLSTVDGVVYVTGADAKSVVLTKDVANGVYINGKDTAVTKAGTYPATSGGNTANGGAAGGSSAGSNTTTTTDGNKVTTVTSTNGSKTITVTNKDGEVLAKVVIAANAPDNGVHFEDVPADHWAAAAINEMAALGVVKGVSTEADIFDMNSTVTRATIAQILFNLSNGKTGIENPFADAAEGWYSDAVAWASYVGVVTGGADGVFAPNTDITREQLAVMLYRFAKLLGLDVTADEAALADFTDAAQVSEWAATEMAWAVKTGLLQGKGNADLDPAGAASRAETAMVMSRLIGLLK